MSHSVTKDALIIGFVTGILPQAPKNSNCMFMPALNQSHISMKYLHYINGPPGQNQCSFVRLTFLVV